MIQNDLDICAYEFKRIKLLLLYVLTVFKHELAKLLDLR